MNSGRTLEEIKRLFNYLEENKTNDDLQIIMTTEGCHDLYELFIDCSKYQKILEERIDKALLYIEEYYDNFGWLQLRPSNLKELMKILKGSEE